MRKVYLDNAATTPVFEEVITEMSDSMRVNYGNPSSSHQFGRTAKSSIENSRKNIANKLNVSSSELIFTSGGTEANNLILRNAVANLNVTKIVTSKLEHKAVLRTLLELEKEAEIQLCYIETDNKGNIDIVDLRKLLSDIDKKTLVSLMFVNNEVGRILDVKKVASICKEYKALFHSDAVQAVGHFEIDLKDMGVDFIAASAHKFHGPKGVGFAYFKKGFGVKPMIFGGEQEKGARAGTEPVHAIMGMNKALELSLENIVEDVQNIQSIKKLCVDLLKKELPEVEFNGGSEYIENYTATILSIRLPKDLPFLLFSLDIKGIAVSGGSACQSGSNKGSHVLESLLPVQEALKTSLRISFSTYTIKDDIEYFVATLKELLQK
tara:strand:+ start:25946 stop:27085 length:1140 start_codon:yes stop_codon:yes gene_type:complete